MSLLCPKHVSELHTELHITCSKYQNEINIVKTRKRNNKRAVLNSKMSERIDKSAGCTVPVAKCQNARKKSQNYNHTNIAQ